MFDYDEVIEEYGNSASVEQTVPEEYEIDFSTGQLTGKKVRGAEAVKMWAWLALQTPKQRFSIYTDDYGENFEDLIGKEYSLEMITSEMKRMITDCLSRNVYIQGIEDFECEIAGDTVSASFTLKTIFGKESMNV